MLRKNQSLNHDVRMMGLEKQHWGPKLCRKVKLLQFTTVLRQGLHGKGLKESVQVLQPSQAIMKLNFASLVLSTGLFPHL